MFPGIPTVICGGFGQSAIFQVSLKLSIVLHLQNISANRIKKKNRNSSQDSVYLLRQAIIICQKI